MKQGTLVLRVWIRVQNRGSPVEDCRRMSKAVKDIEEVLTAAFLSAWYFMCRPDVNTLDT